MNNIKEIKAVLVEAYEDLSSYEKECRKTIIFPDTGEFDWIIEAIGYCSLIENTNDEFVKSNAENKLIKILGNDLYNIMSPKEDFQLKLNFNKQPNYEESKEVKEDNSNYDIDDILTMVF